MVTDRVQDGWQCHLATFMYRQMTGASGTVIKKMHDEVERVYSTFITRVCRKPTSASPDSLPILIGAADLPVAKTDAKKKQIVLANTGLHVHAILLTPPRSRLRGPVTEHFQVNRSTYLPSNKPLFNLHIETVQETHGRVVDYVFKTIASGRLGYDDGVIILPRAIAELGSN